MLTTFAGGRLFGSRTGDGPPRLLALHGWARTHRDFDALLNDGPQPLDALALDLPGFGASPEPPEPYGSERYAQEVSHVLADMATPVVVLGHSFGGMVAVQLAAAHPDDVKALVLAGVPRLVRFTSARRPSTAYRLTRTLRKLHLVSESRLEAARMRYGSEDYRRAQGVMRQVLVTSLGESLESELARLRCPVHLVWGDDDTAAPIAGAEAARDLLGDSADLTVCPGAGHLVPLTATDTLRGVLERVSVVTVAVSSTSHALNALAVAAASLALVVSSPRWLRVAQREHYLAGSCTRFARRWWWSEPINRLLFVAAVAGIVESFWWPYAAFATAAAVAIGPLRLTLRGRTSPLAVTRRLRTLAVVWAVLAAAVIVVGVVVGYGAPVAAVAALASPLVGDLSLALLAPVERRLGTTFVRAATDRLQQVAPQVVAVTGSYGKTSTKNHIAQLLEGDRAVVATPASFNNRAGLARAINEHLVAGTDVFVAEMGTYGPGEIADMCAWCPPDIAVITAIGPVHLERFRSEDRIVVAKAEITERASVVVLNVDDQRLAMLAVSQSAGGGLSTLTTPRTVVRCSALDATADVCVRRDEAGTATLSLAGRVVGEGIALDHALQPGNVACAVAVALRVGVPEERVVERLQVLRGIPNRLSVARAPSGVWVIDDTFNSNPAGARAALHELAAIPSAARRALVTPGMVELGPLQSHENERLAKVASAIATDLVVVGRTNRQALLDGADRLEPVTVRTRQEAVDWVRGQLHDGDAVLYENDLPDHYP